MAQYGRSHTSTGNQSGYGGNQPKKKGWKKWAFGGAALAALGVAGVFLEAVDPDNEPAGPRTLSADRSAASLARRHIDNNGIPGDAFYFFSRPASMEAPDLDRIAHAAFNADGTLTLTDVTEDIFSRTDINELLYPKDFMIRSFHQVLRQLEGIHGDGFDPQVGITKMSHAPGTNGCSPADMCYHIFKDEAGDVHVKVITPDYSAANHDTLLAAKAQMEEFGIYDDRKWNAFKSKIYSQCTKAPGCE